MERSNKQEIDDKLGPVTPGETRYYDIPGTEIVDHVKSQLEKNFCVTVWLTEENTDEDGIALSGLLSDSHIVNYYDRYMRAVACFKTIEDKNHFLNSIKEELNKKGEEDEQA